MLYEKFIPHIQYIYSRMLFRVAWTYDRSVLNTIDFINFEVVSNDPKVIAYKKHKLSHTDL